MTVDYYDSVAIWVAKPGKEGAANRRARGDGEGEARREAGWAAADVTIVGTVTEIAPDKTSVTLKSRDGGLEKLPVKNPENLTRDGR